MDQEVYDTLMSLLDSMRSWAGYNNDLLMALDDAEAAIEEEYRSEDTETE